MALSTEWTVMFYMAGDNSLDKNVQTDLRKLKSAMVDAGGSDRVRVLAQFDRKGVQKSKRFEITRNGTADDFMDDLVDEVGELNTGDPSALINFLTWSIRRAPARRFIVVLWGHGYGVDDETVFEDLGIQPVANRLVRPPLFRSVSETDSKEMGRDRTMENVIRESVTSDFFGGEEEDFEGFIKDFIENTAIGTDDTDKDFLSNVEMKRAFERVRFDGDLGLNRNFDMVLMDACNMSMAEVAYQLRNSVEIMVASEGITPIKGWPYYGILRQLIADPDISPVDLSKLMVREYINFYQPKDDVTQSASNLSACDRLKDKVDKLAGELLDNMGSSSFLDDLRIARYHTQGYYVDNSFVDLHDFCHALAKRTQINSVINACNEVKDAITQNFIISSDCKGKAVRFSRGVSIYFPVGERLKLYRLLDFVKESRWLKFLDSFLAKTERSD